MKILVTGARGQLGCDVISELKKRGHEAIGVDVDEMDITNAEAVKNTLTNNRPDAVIHCAAWTAVDAAEDEENKEKVWQINVTGTETWLNSAKNWIAS